MQNATPTFYTEDQIRGVLTYRDLIPEMKRALVEFSAGRVLQPLRTVLTVAEHSGWLALMPAVYGNIMGAKMVTFYPRNADLQRHTHMAVIQLFRADTGDPLAVLDGRLITEMRTAAVSAIAVDLLADAGARVLAILGSGVQAHSHVRALAGIRNFDEIRVWSRTPEHAQRFAQEIGARATAAEEAVRGADVVLTLTSSATPVLAGRWLKERSLVCAVGAVTPDRRELDDDAMRGPVVVESRIAAQSEPGDILMSKAIIAAELGELLNGSTLVRDGRPIVFKSVGIAIEDIAAAKLVYDKLAKA